MDFGQVLDAMLPPIAFYKHALFIKPFCACPASPSCTQPLQ